MKLSVIIPGYNEIHSIGEILGWFLNGRIIRRKKLPSFQLRIYNLLVPIFKLEELFPLPFGTSLLAVAEKLE
jgi:hypothetical protein